MSDIPTLKPFEHFLYNTHTETVRLMPGNYAVCYRPCKHWICDPDQGIPYPLRMELFSILTQFHTIRWGCGEDVARAFNERIPKEGTVDNVDKPVA